MMRKILKAILLIALLMFAVSVCSANDTEIFPKRKFYPQLNYIDTQECTEGIKNNQYDVIDVRDATSFQALHVKIPVIFL